MKGAFVLTSVKPFEFRERHVEERAGRLQSTVLEPGRADRQHGQKEKEKEKQEERKRCLPIVLVAPRIHRLLPYPYGPRSTMDGTLQLFADFGPFNANALRTCR